MYIRYIYMYHIGNIYIYIYIYVACEGLYTQYIYIAPFKATNIK